MGKYVDGRELLEALFPKRSRPSLRWLRDQQRRRAIPYIKIGRLVRFDVKEVRRALDERFTVRPRHIQKTGNLRQKKGAQL